MIPDHDGVEAATAVEEEDLAADQAAVVVDRRGLEGWMTFVALNVVAAGNTWIIVF